MLGAVSAQPLPTPTFTNVTVHDPSVIKAGARWYVYGSHGASAWTEDLMHWTQVATSVTSGNPAHFNTFASELSELIDWTHADTLWAPDVVQLPDGKFYYYYDVWTNYLNYRSYMGLASADGIEGPFTDVGEIMKGGTNVSGFDPAIHPNTIDPDVFYDRDGQLWMVYGSYSGGIFILRLDQTVGSATFGRPLPGQSWGTKLIGGNHARIEGPCIIYSPESQYYYLFLSFGGLAANDGYNIRVARSRNPDGPYVDAAGNDLKNVGGSDAAIAPYGVKLIGNYQFAHVAGEPRNTSRGYLSPGHNSVYRDPATGKYFLLFHTRFVGLGETHEVRVHQMFLNADGWFVVAPQRYAGETIAPITARQVPGSFKLINHGWVISSAVNGSSLITLNADGTISGSVSGTWQVTGDNSVTLSYNGANYRGVFVLQWDDDNQVWILGFTALSADGTAIWGSKVAALNAVAAPALTGTPSSQTVAAGGTATLTAAASGVPAPELQWERNGSAVVGANSTVLTLANLAPADAGIYTIDASNFAGSAPSAPAIVGLTSAAKVIGTGEELTPVDIHHPNGNIFDQVLLTGAAETITADAGQVTRTSYIDLDNDIVQVEFSGPGSLSLVLDNASGRAKPENYNQDIDYMKGHAGIVITGATENTHVSVFSVGRATAVNQALFKDTVNYDGIADIAFIAISSSNGRFGGVRTANANYFASRGVTGVYAPGVAFDGPVFVGNITAFDAAQPKIVLGSVSDARIAGGDLYQDNGAAVQVSGITQLKFTNGSDSHGNTILAKANRAVLQENGEDVTNRIVTGP
ncbi:family 43 glycosylhydrolase [Opitutus terrae]|nr:family 43 glycosylhydrolase [Opitutus terrae]